ncbi:O-antigen ligase family protein [Vibrio breoganii]|nr:O-antigen ligase family protein [Vibrio breoganii]PMI17902.1 hypothetical protein BCU49_13075 [Vibrio breoganii]
MYNKYASVARKNDYSFIFLSFVIFSSLIYCFKSQFYASCLIALCELVAILFIDQRTKVKILVLPNCRHSVSLYCFLLGVLISLYFLYLNQGLSTVFYHGFLRSTFIIIHFSFGIALFQGYFKTHGIENLLILLPLSVIIYSIFIFLDYNLNINTVLDNRNASLPLISNRRFLGYIALLGALIGTYKLLNTNKLISLDLFSFIAITNLSMMIWLGGRGAIISYIIMVILFVFFDYYYRGNNLRFINIVNLLLLLISSIIITTPLNVFSWNGGLRLAGGSDLYESIEKFGNGRIEIWKEAFFMFTEQPWLGYGAGSYKFLSSFGLNHGFYHPHNLILQILIEFGLFGLLCIGFYLVSLAINSIAFAIKEKDESLDLSIIMVGGLLFHGLVDGTVFHAQPVMILVFLISYICYRVRS